jgi:hypothetical protein
MCLRHRFFLSEGKVETACGGGATVISGTWNAIIIPWREEAHFICSAISLAFGIAACNAFILFSSEG